MSENLNLIEDNLYLGGIEAAESRTCLTKYKIKTILSVVHIEFENCNKFASIAYHRVMAYDSPTQDLLSHFQETNQILAFAQLTNRPVLVHCMAGVSRSSTVVIAFLMNKYRMSSQKALELVGRQRPIVNPNEGFRQQLLLYEEMQFTMNPNNMHFRRHLLETILLNPVFFNTEIFAKSIDAYFERRNLIEKQRKFYFEHKYRCSQVNCNHQLFTDLHLIDNDYRTKTKCGYLFIEPQKWMKQAIKDIIEIKDNRSLSINCPKCEQTIGHFNEDCETFLCSCDRHKGLRCLYFKIDRNYVRKD